MGELTPQRLGRQDLEIVIRRAAELEADYPGDVLDLTEDDVIRIAGEVGLSEGSVRRALAEHYVAVNTEALLVERGWASRLCGPSLVIASRRVPRPADGAGGSFPVQRESKTYPPTEDRLAVGAGVRRCGFAGQVGGHLRARL